MNDDVQTLNRRTVHAVTFISDDDGRRLTDSYFSSSDKAIAHCNEKFARVDASVVQLTAWTGDDGQMYLVEGKPIRVDYHCIRKQAIAKLSMEEREILGL